MTPRTYFIIRYTPSFKDSTLCFFIRSVSEDVVLTDHVSFYLFSLSCGEKAVSVRSLLLAAVCITLAVVWGVYRNDDRSRTHVFCDRFVTCVMYCFRFSDLWFYSFHTSIYQSDLNVRLEKLQK